MQNNLINTLSGLTTLKVGVVGDFALDIYYNLAKDTGEFSLETNKPVHRGTRTRTSLGGAGNVVHNLHDLGVGKIYAFGIYQDDVWGREMLHQLSNLEIDTAYMVLQEDNWETCAYMKPMLKQVEESRIDFGSYNQPQSIAQESLYQNLEEAIEFLDVLIINQQCLAPVIDQDGIRWLNQLAKNNPNCKFFADFRDGGERLSHITLKANVHEACRILQKESVPENDQRKCMQLAKELSSKIHSPVLLTQGEFGMVYIDNENKYAVDGIFVTGETDSVGAGDTVISTFSSCLCAGADPQLALEIANMAAAVTVKKIGETGTASPDEIILLHEDSSYLYNPDIATDLRKANYLDHTDIEVVIPQSDDSQAIQHIIFDHDGTISTLREGWEKVMFPVMMKSICGEYLYGLSQEKHQQLAQKINTFIDQTTGIQTIVQMQGLVEMIDEEGFIPKNQIKTAGEYKAIYLDALMDSVNDRLERFEKGERKLTDFTLSGAVDFLEKLYDMGIQLYLASGTDEDNVIEEATALGYAHFFKGRIYGSKGNEIGDAKRIVINRILEENYCKGRNLMVMGDGPVEIREGRRVGAFTVGVASDEIRRYGLNVSKRARLIKAGAHLVIPDFSQSEYLLKFVNQPMNV